MQAAAVSVAALEDEQHGDTAAAPVGAVATRFGMLNENEDRQRGKEANVAYLPSKVQFHSCIKMVSSGLSFRQTSRVMQDIKETLGLTALGSVLSPQ